MSDTPTWIDVPPYVTDAMREQVLSAYRQGLLQSALPVLLCDLDGRILGANEQFQELLGYDETELQGRLVTDLVAEEDRAQSRAASAELYAGRVERLEYEARSVRGDGRIVWLRRHVFRAENEVTGQACYVGLVEDITEQRMAELQAATLLQIGRDLSAGAPLGTVAERLAELAAARWDRAECSLSVLDPTGTELLPVPHARLPQDYLDELIPIPVGSAGGVSGNAAATGVRVASADLGQDPRAAAVRGTLDRLGIVSGWSVPVTDASGAIVGAFSLYHRVRREPTEQEWQSLESLAAVAGLGITAQAQRRQHELDQARLRRDALTGLPNGLAFTETVTALSSTERPLTVVVVRAQLVADVATHLGDRSATAVLRALFERAAGLGDVCALGQVGPAVLALAAETAWTVAEVRKLERVLRRPVRAGEAAVRPRLSLGFAVKAPHADVDPDLLLRQAAVALPTHGVAAFDPTAAGDPTARYTLAGQVRRALLEHEFVLHYQPKYDLRTGAIVGSEALVRWQHPQLGLLAPPQFLPAIELAGAGPDLAVYVCRQATRDSDAREQAGLTGRVAVNLTAEDLHTEQLLAFLCDREEQRWTELDVELTETSLADEHTAEALGTLATVGYQVALDDFGTGYSSLSALQALPLAAVKIDRSFIDRLPADKASAALIGAVGAMCAELGMQVIAEGVETDEQARAAARLGCSTGQGFLWCKPLPLLEHQTRRTEHLARPQPVSNKVAVASLIARQMYSEGASVATIAAALNARGQTTASGRRWHRTSVTRLLHDRG